MAHDVATLSIGSGPKNEDRVISIERGATRLIVVADGAGGTGNGAEAAELALKSIIDSRLMPTLVRDPNYWSQTLSMLDRYIHRENEVGECTIVVVAINDGHIIGGSVGDSEAWLFMEDEDIELTWNQVRKPLMGSSEATAKSFGPVPFKGTLLVATDGLVKYAPLKQIKDVAINGSAETAAEQLSKIVRLPSGALQDDIAIAVCKPDPH